MKFILLTFESKKEVWVDEAIQQYNEKIKHFVDFELIKLKSPNVDRDNRKLKIEQEAQVFLKNIKKDDLVVLMDEAGLQQDSLQFSKTLIKFVESGKKRVVFIVGGAFGVSDEIKNISSFKLALSKITMNHLVAQIVLLEQIYRGFTIYKGLPYHNG